MVFQDETKAREEKAMNESIEIVGNLKAEMKKISSDIVNDRAHFQTEIADIKETFNIFQNESKAREEKALHESIEIVGNLKAEMKKISSDIVNDRARFQIKMSDIKESFMVLQNETKAREEKAMDELMSLAGECFIVMNVTFPPNWGFRKAGMAKKRLL